MPTYLYPGVYVKELPDGVHPIEGVPTAVAGYVGLTEGGPFDTPSLVGSWTQFSATFGGFVTGMYLAQSVYAHFSNGGGNCYIVRVGQGCSAGDSPPRSIRAEDYVGDVAVGTGLAGLEAIPEITMLCVPDLMGAYESGTIDLATVQSVQTAMISHAELMGNRIAILDPPPGLDAQQVRQWRVDSAPYDSKHGALYWPWVRTSDPATHSLTFMPPSGHIAGIWGRSDDTHGVSRAPANEVISGAIDVETHVTRSEQELLNPEGVNVIRAFPGRGIRVWGARTLSSDPEWRFLNVQRYLTYVEQSILSGTAWAVFEPNDAALWARIRLQIADFLTTEWRKGALVGATPHEAFYVKCDSDINPSDSVDAGQFTCEMGVALVKPAEFVIFRLSQSASGEVAPQRRVVEADDGERAPGAQ